MSELSELLGGTVTAVVNRQEPAPVPYHKDQLAEKLNGLGERPLIEMKNAGRVLVSYFRVGAGSCYLGTPALGTNRSLLRRAS